MKSTMISLALCALFAANGVFAAPAARRAKLMTRNVRILSRIFCSEANKAHNDAGGGYGPWRASVSHSRL
jgi:hypothetical protein